MSSSDFTVSAARGYIPPRTDEERRLMKRVEELAASAAARGAARHTGFLSDREQELARAALNRAGCACARFWGGFEGAERKILYIEPPDAWHGEAPLAFLRMEAPGRPQTPPAHRDYLGAILGLGLERACVGDLLAAPDGVFFAVVLADKAAFVARELTSAGRCPVRAAVCAALPPEALHGPERELHEATVPSLRADSVLAAMMHTSRACAAEQIAAGRVEVNHVPLRSAHESAYEGDVFTVRGAGRWRLAAVGGKSRKDRLFISFFQY